jgi:Tfp pilus assembly protein PilV
MCVNERSTSSKAVEGFTLLEIMIAAGVMAMGLVLVFGALVSIAETNQTSQTRTVANAQVNSVLEEVQALGPVELASYQPPPMPGLGAGANAPGRGSCR